MRHFKRFRSMRDVREEPEPGYRFKEDVEVGKIIFDQNQMKDKVPAARENRVYDAVELIARSLLSDPSVTAVEHLRLLLVRADDDALVVDYELRAQSGVWLDPAALAHERVRQHVIRVGAVMPDKDGWRCTVRVRVAD
jgi:hypothetical protein